MTVQLVADLALAQNARGGGELKLDSNLLEEISADMHDAWMATKRSQGVTTRKAEDGEELMVEYTLLSEKAKDLDRGSVRSVFASLERKGYKVVK